jgi:hypothetical protein
MKVKFCCWVCGADPAGFNPEQPPKNIFREDRHDDGSPRIDPIYACREHVSKRREQELQRREREHGFTIR